jgi:ATP synthase F1 delta subunit
MKHLTIKEMAELWFTFTEKYGRDKAILFLAELITVERREKEIDAIAATIERLNYEKNRQLLVSVVSAHALTESLRESITQLVKKVTQAQTVVMKVTTDTSLIGGFTASALDWQIDASVKRTLNQLEAV